MIEVKVLFMLIPDHIPDFKVFSTHRVNCETYFNHPGHID